MGGATLAGFDLVAQRLFKKEGKLDEIAVAASADTTSAPFCRRTRRSWTQEQASEDAAETNEFITFLQGFLLAFAGIALFVGSFVIANSLSITIAQRTREFATVRSRASRRQVLGSIVVEALVVGVLSLIGLFLGLGLASLLFWLFEAAASRCRTAACCSRRARSPVPARRDSRDARRQPPAGASRHARAGPLRPCARARRCPSSLRPFPHARLARDHGARLRRARLRPLRKRPRHDRDPSGMVSRPPTSIGVALFATSLSGCSRPCSASRRRGWRRGLARDNARRNRNAPPPCRRAHASAWPSWTLVATSCRDHEHVSRRRRRPLRRGLRDHGTEQLLADPDRMRQRRPRKPTASRPWRAPEPARRAVFTAPSSSPQSTRTSVSVAVVEGSQAVFAELGGDRAFRGRRLRRRPRPLDRLADPGHRSSGNRLQLEIEGILRPACRRLAVRVGHVLERGLRPRIRLAAEPLASCSWRAARRRRTRRRSRTRSRGSEC